MSSYPCCVVPLPGSIHLENVQVYRKTIHKNSIYNSPFYTKYIHNQSFAQIRDKTNKKQSHNRLSSIVRSWTGVSRLYLTCTRNMVPRRGEQCPVENNFYKSYSPPKCTCNAIITSYHLPYRICNPTMEYYMS